MLGRERFELIFILRENLFNQLLDAVVESALPQHASVRMNPPCSTKLRRFFASDC